jgi:hypothetical protein
VCVLDVAEWRGGEWSRVERSGVECLGGRTVKCGEVVVVRVRVWCSVVFCNVV